MPVTTHNFFFNTSSSWCLLTRRVKIHYLPTYRHKNEHHVTANDGSCSSVPLHLPHSRSFIAYSRCTCKFLHVKPWRWLFSVTWHVGSLENIYQRLDKCCFLFIQGRRRKQVSTKHLCMSIRLHGVISQKTATFIFITVATLNLAHTTWRTAHTSHYTHWASQAYRNDKVLTLSNMPLRRTDSGSIHSRIIHPNSRGRCQLHNPAALSQQKWHQYPVHNRLNGLRTFQNAVE